MKCAAVENGAVKRKGNPSLEWYMGDHPQYYCLGWVDRMTDELIPECKRCSRYVDKAQEDFVQYRKAMENKDGTVY